MSRATRFDADKADAREQLYKLRESVLGVGHEAVHRWQEALPEHPASFRERFLQICALGGALPFEALGYGVTLRPMSHRNEWLVQSLNTDGQYQLHLWVHPKAPRYSTRPWTIHGCDAELHDGWNTDSWRRTRKRVRTGKIIVRGTVRECFEMARQLFTSWDAIARLGGQPEPLVMF